MVIKCFHRFFPPRWSRLKRPRIVINNKRDIYGPKNPGALVITSFPLMRTTSEPCGVLITGDVFIRIWWIAMEFVTDIHMGPRWRTVMITGIPQFFGLWINISPTVGCLTIQFGTQVEYIAEFLCDPGLQSNILKLSPMGCVQIPAELTFPSSWTVRWLQFQFSHVNTQVNIIPNISTSTLSF